MNCSRVTIQNVWRRFEQGQGIEDLPRSGRPPVTTPNQDHYILLQHACLLQRACVDCASTRCRLACANNRVGWTRQQWRESLFTDESKFNLSFAGGNVHIYRHRGETFAQVCVLEHNRLGGGGIMVWFFSHIQNVSFLMMWIIYTYHFIYI